MDFSNFPLATRFPPLYTNTDYRGIQFPATVNFIHRRNFPPPTKSRRRGRSTTPETSSHFYRRTSNALIPPLEGSKVNVRVLSSFSEKVAVIADSSRDIRILLSSFPSPRPLTRRGRFRVNRSSWKVSLRPARTHASVTTVVIEFLRLIQRCRARTPRLVVKYKSERNVAQRVAQRKYYLSIYFP